jgi:Spy/CpxP family protein refolding chaperone
MMLILALALAAPAAEAQVRPLQQRRGMAERPADRALLEAQVMQRFLQVTTQRMELADDGRRRLEGILRRSAEERRAMHQESQRLQTALQAAVRSGSEEADVSALLAGITELRQRELRLWEREQRELGQLLTPRQHAMYMVQWLRLQESIRGIMGRRQGGPPPPGI